MWALIGGIASVLSILTWLGVSNAGELKDLVADSPPQFQPGPVHVFADRPHPR
ncbi:hypothetical protein ACFYMI_22125 [Streptomyces collinus]|uniref:hypothetical protein n=1 Tax=Streptomyces collinus TaxID=42684 RepID=UPI00369D8962